MPCGYYKSRMSQPVISVVMPAYNHERFVGAAVKSVLGQTFHDLELIVIDDGSTDGTAAVIRNFSDPRLHYHHQTNQDAFNALNRGISLARGECIAIINSDDVYHPERLSHLLDTQKSTGAEALFTNVIPINAAGNSIPVDAHYWHLWHQRNRNFYFECGDLFTAFLHGNLMATTSNLFMTAAAARTIGPFAPIRYLHDYDYIFRLLIAFPGRVHYLHDETLLEYRIHGNNTLSQGALLAREQNRDLVLKYMLLGLPESSRVRARTGAKRLAELERELESVRRQMRIPRILRPTVNAIYRMVNR